MKRLDPLSIPLSGTQLVEASAGTGKTYTITTLVTRLLLEQELDIRQILVVTFTNAATAELRDRVRTRLRQTLDVLEGRTGSRDEVLEGVLGRVDRQDAKDRLAAALANVDEAAVLTIHGFCQRILQSHAFDTASRFDVELRPDARALISDLVHDFWTERTHGASEAWVAHLAYRDSHVDELIGLATLATSAPDMPVVQASPGQDPQSLVDAFVAVRGETREAWKQARQEVCRLLLTSQDLKRTHYRESSVERWITDLDALLADTSSTLVGFFDDLRRLCPDELARGTKKGGRPVTHAFFEQVAKLVDAADQALDALDRKTLALKLELIELVRQRLPELKQQEGIQTFDDLLFELRGALRSPLAQKFIRSLRAEFSVALIDEFHDTDPVQYEIFRTLFSGKDAGLFLIGDPKQAIYAFRGADVFAYLGAVKDADAGWTLTTSYRSDPSLVKALNTLFSNVETPFLLDEIAFRPVGTPADAADALTRNGSPAASLEIRFVPRDGKKMPSSNRIPEIVTEEIAWLVTSDARLDGQPIEPGDIAVLTRSNREAKDIQDALGARGIPSVLAGDSSVFQTEEAAELACVMQAIADPGDPSAVKAALATRILGLDASELFSLSDDTKWEAWVEDFRRWQRLWEARGFVHAARRLLRDKEVAPRLLSESGGERRMTNVLHLVELVHTEESTRRLRIPGVLQWFDDVRHGEGRDGQMAPEAQQLRLESDARAVQLTTMHRSKGLEYRVVICPSLWRSGHLWDRERARLKYHDPERGGSLTLDLRPADEKQEALAIAEREAFAESLRLCYVALTRAKHHLIVLWGAFRGAESSPLGYLLHPPGQEGFGTDAAARIRAAEDAELLEDLERLVERSEGTIDVSPVRDASAPPIVRKRNDTVPLTALTARRVVSPAFRLSSFTALVSGAARDPLGGRDVDQAPVDQAPVVPLPRIVGTTEEPQVRLANFPRGALAGEALHLVLEKVDFDRAGQATDLVSDVLGRHGFDAETWAGDVTQAISECLGARLGPDGPRLETVAPGLMMREMEFTLPAARTRAGDDTLLTPARLAEAFAKHALPPCSTDYSTRLSALGFRPLAGYLRGFIDLVFEHEGKTYVVDYKSNHLGPAPTDYGPAALQEAMQSHHYILQYHLYAVAVHRYLAARRPSYDYDRDFGGVYYLFLRGMHPDAPGQGVYYDRPPRPLVDALARLVGGQSIREAS